MSFYNPHVPSLALIGVTGYGTIYWEYVCEAVAAGKVRLVAAVVINPAEAESAVAEMKRFGTRIYSFYREMLEAETGKVDLCLIPTGIAWHARMTVAALEAGMNVLVEKPLAGSIADAQAIRAAEAKSKRWVAVGFQDMYCPEVLWLKNIVCSGGIGDLRRVRMVGLWPRAISYFERNQWAGKLEADGARVLDSPLNNAFAHFVNLSFFLTGQEVTSSADVRATEARLWRAHSIESFDTGFVRGESDNGIQFEFFVSHACPRVRDPVIVIEGASGVAEWHHEGPVNLWVDGQPPVKRGFPGNSETRQTMFETALGKLTDPTVFLCGTEIAEKHTAFIDGIHRLGPIREIVSREITWVPPGKGADSDSDSIPVVRGIDEAFSGGLENPSGGKLRMAELFEALSKFSPACSKPANQSAYSVNP